MSDTKLNLLCTLSHYIPASWLPQVVSISNLPIGLYIVLIFTVGLIINVTRMLRSILGCHAPFAVFLFFLIPFCTPSRNTAIIVGLLVLSYYFLRTSSYWLSAATFIHLALLDHTLSFGYLNLLTVLAIDVLSIVVYLLASSRTVIRYFLAQAGLSVLLWLTFAFGNIFTIALVILLKIGFFTQVRMLSDLYRGIPGSLTLYIGASNLALFIVLDPHMAPDHAAFITIPASLFLYIYALY